MAYTIIVTRDPLPSTRVILRRRSAPPVGTRYPESLIQRIEPVVAEPTCLVAE